MSLKYVVGDLVDNHLNGEEVIIAHQANCFNLMGSGIAKQIALKIPSAKAADSNTVKGDARKLGKFTMAFSPTGLVFNLYGQFNPGKNTDYEYLKQSLRSMSVFLQGAKSIFPCAVFKKIALPKIGAGIGGGNWSTIEKIISEELNSFKVKIYVLDEKEIPENKL